jgi:TFIIF-interacting CTD phosphatase-like protein
MMQNRKLLILDLDETLIHTAYSPILNRKLKSHRGLYYLYERPFLQQFLDRYLAEYDLAIWSASKAEYVRWIIKSTVLQEYKYEFINTRRHCQRNLGKIGSFEFYKDITPYYSKYENVVMLDDFPEMVRPIECCIKASEYRGGDDDFLLKICPDKINDIHAK